MITTESGENNYFTQISNGIASINADTAKDKNGSGDYFRPHDLIGAGFASCLNITVRMVLERMNLTYEKVITKVDLDREDDATTFLYQVEIVGDMDEATKARVIAKALDCPVRKTLSNKIDFQPFTNNAEREVSKS